MFAGKVRELEFLETVFRQPADEGQQSQRRWLMVRGGCAPLLGAVCFWALAGCALSPVCPLPWSLREAEWALGKDKVPLQTLRSESQAAPAGQEQDLGRWEPSHCAAVGPGWGSRFSAALAVPASALASSELLQNLPFFFFVVVSVFSLYEPVASGSRKVQ